MTTPRTRHAVLTVAADGAGGAGVSAVHDQFWRIQASYASEPEIALLPRSVRVAIMVGAPAALWTLLIVAVGAVAHAISA